MRLSFSQLFMIAILAVTLSGCSSFGRKLKGFLGGKSESPAEATKKNNLIKYSENANHLNAPRRQYKRVTKKSFEEQAQLNEKSGSLWTMEGQGAYLFSQNIIRMIGDPIGVKIEGEPKEHLQTKVNVIKKLLAKLEERQKARLRGPAEDPQPEKKTDEKAATPAAKPAPPPPPPVEEVAELEVKTVPTRIIERLIDGNYRVKGDQPFMIGPREYKMIVTGIVRAEDFNEEGISATKLLDPKFDIVSVRRKDAGI